MHRISNNFRAFIFIIITFITVPLSHAEIKKYPLHEAAMTGDIVQVRSLLKSGHKVNTQNTDNFFPIELASGRGHLDVVKELIKNGADKNLALVRAAMGGRIAIIEYLLTIDVDVNKKILGDMEPIFYTFFFNCNENNLDSLKLLVENGAALDVKLKNGLTPLKFAQTLVKSNPNCEKIKKYLESKTDK